MKEKFSTYNNIFAVKNINVRKGQKITVMKKRDIMKKNSLMTGIGIGMAVGGATAFIRGAWKGSGMKRSVKKNMSKAMKSAEGIISDIGYMFR